MQSKGLFEIAGTIIEPGFGCYGTGFLLLNKDVYDEFPDSVKKLMEEMHAEWIVVGAESNMRLLQPAVEAIKEAGIKVIVFDEAQKKEWFDIIEPEKMWFEMAEADEAKYGVPAVEGLLRYMGLIPVYENKTIYTNPLGS